MKHISLATIGIIIFVAMSLSATIASAATVTLQNISPGTTLMAKNNLSFTIAPVGFTAPIYHVSDTFPGTSIVADDISSGGMFSWTPSAQDAGEHTITIAVSDYNGNAANVVQTITVTPPPSVSITALSPGPAVMSGNAVTFTVTSTGFTNPTYTIGDAASYSEVTQKNLDQSGYFVWKPTLSENGDHTITVYGTDSLGHHAEASVHVRVGSGPQITVGQMTPGPTVNAGQTLSFVAFASNFTPTGFSAYDTFPGTTISNGNINQAGQFVWTPGGGDIGTHTVTIGGVVGALGASANTNITLTVLSKDGVPAPQTTAATSSTSASTSTTALSDLQAKLALLQSAIAQSANSTPTAQLPPIFVSMLHLGSNSDEVRQLQNVLQTLGFLTVAPNGNFGPGTKAAVIKFQTAHKLEQTGAVGPQTRAALNVLGTTTTTAAIDMSAAPTTSVQGSGYIFEHFMGVGDDDVDVTELQTRLTSLGFLSGGVTGFYGPLTETAVKKFQKSKGLIQTGYVEKTTRAALNAQ